ncbi:hypothetical protein [Legionella quateirensis]|uniref:Uncharacterized protein n=1 Tax=Legionella quateirensis TaxID=45072 RepID=A0A378KPR7_9GAMM|nr:hypothetical protein [Legionella quateirensis]KTD54714.1 hypothetical protein Lqua_0221 [Legionella quateirensis]STY16894.1 Uncharacterised protein [Legionella quateirensis]
MSKVKGPKDSVFSSAIFEGKANGTVKSRFPSLTDTKDLVLLSIKGNEQCEGKYLGALVQYAVDTHQNKPDGVTSKGKTTFLIADEIYWHNLRSLPPEAESEEELKRQALAMGEAYFKANLDQFLAPLGLNSIEFSSSNADKSVDEQIAFINKLALDMGKNFEIMRWHTWISQDNAEEKIQEMIPLYKTTDGLRAAIDTDVDSFVMRHRDDTAASQELWRHRSVNYLTEENPSIMWLGGSLGYNFIIYPGKILSSFEETKKYFLVKDHKPYIRDGQSISDDCAHSSLSTHVADPNKLVNWLEPTFVNYNPPKGDRDPSKEKGHAFFTVPETKKSSRHKQLQGLSSESDQPMSMMEHNNTSSAASSSQDDVILSSASCKLIISSMIEGFNLALNHPEITQFLQDGPQTTYPALVVIFQNMTKQILNSALDPIEKVDIVKSLLESCLHIENPSAKYKTSL